MAIPNGEDRDPRGWGPWSGAARAFVLGLIAAIALPVDVDGTFAMTP